MNDTTTTCIKDEYNITDEPTTAAIVTKGVFLTVVVTLSFVSNTLCLVVLPRVRDRSLQKVTKIFMISFTVCDIFGIFFSYIPMTVSTFLHNWPFGDTMCWINGFAGTIFAYTSGIQLLALNLERYLAISYPLKWYHVYVTPFRARITVVLLWMSAVTFSAVAYSLPNRYTAYSLFLGVCNSNPCGHEPDISGTILSSAFFVSPVLLTLLLWLKLYLLAKRHTKAIVSQARAINLGTLERERKYSQDSLKSAASMDSPCRSPVSKDSPVQKEIDRKTSKISLGLKSLAGTLERRKASKASTTEQHAVKANRRAFFTFFIMSICMALLSLPFIIVIVYDNTQRQMLSYGFIAVAEILIVSFGFLNVVIYYARNKAFRKAAKKLFCSPADPYSRPSRACITNGRTIAPEGTHGTMSRGDVTQADV
ncbi:beta-3 adrenergic receptor-like [Amphiura filiformis]|uniref:beta-3 adrenergic receptor-like n=1 Tax=Amphiura filiformis TaxID=82378 RepID=UPI003B215959